MRIDVNRYGRAVDRQFEAGRGKPEVRLFENRGGTSGEEMTVVKALSKD